jgi:hypothetical protein
MLDLVREHPLACFLLVPFVIFSVAGAAIVTPIIVREVVHVVVASVIDSTL